MAIHSLHDKAEIAAFLRRNTFLHIYSLGDLDDFFWPHTVWYGLREGGHLKAVILLYTAMRPPVLLALAPPEETAPMQRLLEASLPLLPKAIYGHFSPKLVETLAHAYHITPYGQHYKMALNGPLQIEQVDISRVVPLIKADLPALAQLYAAGYPDNAFDPRMLETQQFFGVWEREQLISVAGIHVYSPNFRVAALGNIVTHPDFRGRGFGKAVTARLCHSLLAQVDAIGLNVKADNACAIRIYKQLGFEIVAAYDELTGVSTR